MAKIFDRLILKSWWVILFILACYMAYERGIRKTQGQYEQLVKQHQELQAELRASLTLQEELILQINSQSDPAWVELTLMKGLGLVPEGQTKIFFKNK